MTYEQYAEIYKAIGDPTRAKIFDMLKGGEMCACKILDEFNITQPTLSYHMKMLTDCNLVTSVKDGKWNHYSLNWNTINELIVFFDRKATVTVNCKCK